MAGTNSSHSTQYDRPGGHNVIAKIIGELHDRLFSDRHTWYYWKGLSADDKAAECRLFIDLVRANEGASVVSQGPDMKTTVKPLGIGKVAVRAHEWV